MDTEVNYLTQDKKKELEAELAELEGPKREENLKALSYAKSLGDLSENAEYHQAREDQGKLQERINKVRSILENSKVISASGGDTVSMGSTVVVQKVGEKETKTYVIVGSEEANMAEGKISNRSPIGMAMMGKKKGDEFSFEAPSGKVNFSVIDVS